MVRIFYVKVDFVRVFLLSSTAEKGNFDFKVRYFHFLSPSHRFLRVTGEHIDFKGVTLGVDFCIIFTGFHFCRTIF